MIDRLNTYSNLAFAVIGIYALLESSYLPYISLFAFVGMGITSGLFHHTGKKWARRLDEVFMYFIAITIIGATLDAIGAQENEVRAAVIVWFAVCAVSVGHMDSHVWMPILVGLAIIFAGVCTVAFEIGSLFQVILAALVIVTGVVIRQLDENRDAKGHTEKYGIGHAIFHIVEAIGLGILLFSVQ